MSFPKAARVLVLLAVLLVVAVTQCQSREQLASWDRALWITIHPVLVEDRPDVRRFLSELAPKHFAPVNDFLMREARRHGVDSVDPLVFQVAQPGTSLPPQPPRNGNRFAIALWSLKSRWWVVRQGWQDDLPPPDIRMFVLFHPPGGPELRETSIGMQKGAYGVVHAKASRADLPEDLLLLSHELMHVLGATDKYDLYNGQPLVPYGLAEPQREPLFPQRYCEIMAMRIAQGPNRSQPAESVRGCVVGDLTAVEIGWR